MKAMASGFGRRALLPRKAEELSAPIKVVRNQSAQHAHLAESIELDTLGLDEAGKKVERPWVSCIEF